MISNFYSVEFLYVIFIFFGYSGSSTELKFLLMTRNDIIRCSQYEYIVISDWFKFKSLNISCPNQATFFENPSIPIYNYSLFYAYCNDVSKNFNVKFYAWNLELANGKLPKFKDKTLKLLSSTINVENHNYLCEAVKMEENASVALVNDFVLNWSDNNTFILYLTFNQQPTVCRISLTLNQKVNVTQCTDELAQRSIICYNDPLSKSPMTNVNWTSVQSFLNNPAYYPPDWRDKGGYYIDLRSVKTTITSVSCFFQLSILTYVVQCFQNFNSVWITSTQIIVELI